MDVLEPVVRAYEWGSHDVIARIRGRAVPSSGPEAELWFGAHSRAAPEEMRGLADQLQETLLHTGHPTPDLERLLATRL